MNKEIKQIEEEFDKEFQFNTKQFKEYMDSKLDGRLKSFLKAKLDQQKQDLIKKIKERADKLYCTAEHLGYHDKNCEGLPCEKAVLLDIIKFLTP